MDRAQLDLVGRNLHIFTKTPGLNVRGESSTSRIDKRLSADTHLVGCRHPHILMKSSPSMRMSENWRVRPTRFFTFLRNSPPLQGPSAAVSLAAAWILQVDITNGLNLGNIYTSASNTKPALIGALSARTTTISFSRARRLAFENFMATRSRQPARRTSVC